MNNDEHPDQLMMRRDPETLRQSDDMGSALRPSRIAALGAVVMAGLCLCGYSRSELASSPSKETPANSIEKAVHLGAGLPVVAPSLAEGALAQSGYSTPDRARIMALLKRHDVSLVRMPIAELDGARGNAVQIDTAGFSQKVTLGSALKTVVLPITHAGEVSITPARLTPGATLATGVLTVYGMYTLPTLSSSQLVILDVVAQ